MLANFRKTDTPFRHYKARQVRGREIAILRIFDTPRTLRNCEGTERDTAKQLKTDFLLVASRLFIIPAKQLTAREWHPFLRSNLPQATLDGRAPDRTMSENVFHSYSPVKPGASAGDHPSLTKPPTQDNLVLVELLALTGWLSPQLLSLASVRCLNCLIDMWKPRQDRKHCMQQHAQAGVDS